MLHMARLPQLHSAALLHPAIMCGPVTATTRPASAQLSSPNHPAATEMGRPGKQPQSASSSKNCPAQLVQSVRRPSTVGSPVRAQDGVKILSAWGHQVQRLKH